MHSKGVKTTIIQPELPLKGLAGWQKTTKKGPNGTTTVVVTKNS